MMPTIEAEFTNSETLGAPPQINTSSWVTMKFGGTSVTGAKNWQNITALISNRHHEKLKTFVVLSALAGVSNALAAIGRLEKPQLQLNKIAEIHLEQISELGLNKNLLQEPLRQLKQLHHQLEQNPNDLDALVQIMAWGEITSTQLACAYLETQNVATQWLDATEWLVCEERENKNERTQRLSAVCNPVYDEQLIAHIGDHNCIVTQGFVASNPQREKVLLGRGGSDSSGAYFSAKLPSQRLEIWTDVPGIFSANPHDMPNARSLSALHYDEAQEIAATGGSVLHPRCLSVPAQRSIPIFVRSLTKPELSGTCISKLTPDSEAHVKAVSYREGLKLISIDNVAMWNEVGFLAETFSVFQKFGVSLDLISTSATSITVSIDPSGDELATEHLENLLSALQSLGTVTLIDQCASVSLVGRKIRTMLHKLGPALEVFSEHKIHLLSQAANDLNLTVVVNQDQGKRLAVRLHDIVITQDINEQQFGPSWQQTQLANQAVAQQYRDKPWWQQNQSQLIALLQNRDCAYVYHLETVRERARQIKQLSSLGNALYAMKANPNRDVLRAVYSQNMSFECVSPGEIKRLFELFPDINRQRILFTPNFASREDYRFGLQAGVRVTLDNLFPLIHWKEDFNKCNLFVRLDPGRGRGHHELVRTAGAQSKFGIPLFELDELASRAQDANARIVGIHAHSGSGIMDATSWNDVGHVLATAANKFPHVQTIDLGGGLGVPEKPQDTPLNMNKLNNAIALLRKDYPNYDFWMEPGRFIVAESGVLIARVTQTKGKGNTKYVGISTGMNSLIRPALYGAYHEIVNLSRLKQPATERYTIVGPNCETGDRLGLDRTLPPCEEGDVLLIANTGAYGFAMSSHYNLREPATELVID